MKSQYECLLAWQCQGDFPDETNVSLLERCSDTARRCCWFRINILEDLHTTNFSCSKLNLFKVYNYSM